MEMSSACPREDHAAQPEQMTQRRPLRGPHGGWQKHEIEALERVIGEAEQQGESLRSAFERLSAELGRKPNSIRNFYYAQIREKDDSLKGRAATFETFTQDEVEQLIESVLAARAQGMSVRACVRNLAGGDTTRMLRYQNKYRSTVRARPELVQRVMQRMRMAGKPYISPYGPGETTDAPVPTLAGLADRAKSTGDADVTRLVGTLGRLIDMAYAPREDGALPGDSDAQRKADRLSARCDLLRIALDDERTRMNALRSEAEGMVTLIKEYIALPDEERGAHTALFCEQAASRLSAVECAMMDAPTDQQ